MKSMRILDMNLTDAEPAPQKGDRAVIIPMHADADRACRIAGVFREAGVLTIGMSPMEVGSEVTCFDGIMYTNEYGCETFGNELIRTLELPGPVKIDVSDLSWLLRDNCRFTMRQFRAHNWKAPFHEILESAAENFAAMSFSEGDRVAVIFTVAPDDNSISVEDMGRLNSPAGLVPENVDLMWGVHFDDALPRGSAGALVVIVGEQTIEAIDEIDDLSELFI